MTNCIALIEAAVSCGSPTQGSEHAYRALLRDLLHCFPGALCFPMDPIHPCESYPAHLKHLDTVMRVSRHLRENVLAALNKGCYPIVIGGDHSIAMGTLAALGEYYGSENLALVYIDAHPDFNTERSSVSACIHGMDLAAACGLCCDELTVGKQRVNILGKNIHIIGARSIDPPEYEIMAEQNVDLCTAEELHRRGASAVIEELLPKLSGKHVHISFDVDFFDPSAFTATGYNLVNGGTYDQLLQILEPLLCSGQTVSFECVEYNPTLDKDGKDKALLCDLFAHLNTYLNKENAP